MNEEKKDENFTKEELLAIIKSTLQKNSQTPPTTNQTPEQKTILPPFINTLNIPPQQITPEGEKQKIAKTIMKLHSNIILLSLLLFTIPFITMLTALMDPKIALIIPMITIIYPAWLYAQSKKAQYYLSKKYHIKPFMFFKIRIKNNRKDDIF